MVLVSDLDLAGGCPYHPNAKVMYALITGPSATPTLAEPMYVNIIQMRSFELNISSMLPLMEHVGTADKNPVTSRPITAATGESIPPMIAQNPLYTTVVTTYSFLRPKASAYGGKTRPPSAWAKR